MIDAAPGHPPPGDAAPVALVLRALYLGDMLTGLPALRMLRTALPGHRIVLAAPQTAGRLALMAGVVDELTPGVGAGRADRGAARGRRRDRPARQRPAEPGSARTHRGAANHRVLRRRPPVERRRARGHAMVPSRRRSLDVDPPWPAAGRVAAVPPPLRSRRARCACANGTSSGLTVVHPGAKARIPAVAPGALRRADPSAGRGWTPSRGHRRPGRGTAGRQHRVPGRSNAAHRAVAATTAGLGRARPAGHLRRHRSCPRRLRVRDAVGGALRTGPSSGVGSAGWTDRIGRCGRPNPATAAIRTPIEPDVVLLRISVDDVVAATDVVESAGVDPDQVGPAQIAVVRSAVPTAVHADPAVPRSLRSGRPCRWWPHQTCAGAARTRSRTAR